MAEQPQAESKEPKLTIDESLSNLLAEVDNATLGAYRRYKLAGSWRGKTQRLEWIALGGEPPAVPTVRLRQFGVYCTSAAFVTEIMALDGETMRKERRAWCYVRADQFRWADRVMRAGPHGTAYMMVSDAHPSNRGDIAPMSLSASWGAPVRPLDLMSKIDAAIGRQFGYDTVKAARAGAKRSAKLAVKEMFSL